MAQSGNPCTCDNKPATVNGCTRIHAEQFALVNTYDTAILFMHPLQLNIMLAKATRYNVNRC